MKKTILFVDDHQSVLMGFRWANIFFKDYELCFAENGLKALKIMNQKTIDVVVSDLNMPEMDGLELFQVVALKYPQTFRILHSASFDEEFLSRAKKYCHQFLTKPCDLDVLRDIINKALREEIETCSKESFSLNSTCNL
jgi:DNA-binding NtrC family response regulator